MTHYVHHVPGRLRVRLPQLRRNPDYAEQLQSTLQGLPGVLRVHANPLTGGLLIHYEPRTISIATLERAVPELVLAPLNCPVCAAPQKTYRPLVVDVSPAGGVLEGVGSALLGMAVDKAMTRSARALFGVLF